MKNKTLWLSAAVLGVLIALPLLAQGGSSRKARTEPSVQAPAGCPSSCAAECGEKCDGKCKGECGEKCDCGGKCGEKCKEKCGEKCSCEGKCDGKCKEKCGEKCDCGGKCDGHQGGKECGEPKSEGCHGSKKGCGGCGTHKAPEFDADVQVVGPGR